MTGLDRVGNNDNFNFREFHCFCKSMRSACRQCEKRLNVCTVMVLLHIYSKSLSVRSPVCPVNKNQVLIPIKLLVVYINVPKLYYNGVYAQCQPYHYGLFLRCFPKPNILLSQGHCQMSSRRREFLQPLKHNEKHLIDAIYRDF